MATKIFISFHQNVALAECVSSLLRKVFPKFEVFVSTGILPGRDWLNQIKIALKETDVVVPLLTNNGLQNPWVNFECGAAWLADKPIVSVCFRDDVKVPMPYSSFQLARLPEETEKFVRGLVDVLNVKKMNWQKLRDKRIFENFADDLSRCIRE